jgi:hypothetical protein
MKTATLRALQMTDVGLDHSRGAGAALRFFRRGWWALTVSATITRLSKSRGSISRKPRVRHNLPTRLEVAPTSL